MPERAPRSICFMVMPFGTKAVQPRPEGAPETIDFDALWNRALAPLIEALGYDPVRADQDTGASIILEMLERLYFSDLVVADMTIPNANVYYEVGIRHACKKTGCLLIGADWSRPVFDVNQMRRLVYPLPNGRVSDSDAAAIQAALRGGAQALADGASPMYQHLPGFPDPKAIDPQRASVIRGQLDAMAAFQARVRAARVCADATQAAQMARQLRDDHPARQPQPQGVPLEVAMLLRDLVGWQDCIDYIDALPEALRTGDLLQEQRALALSKTGNHLEAIGALQALIAQRGASAERLGLIGGRYKKLAAQAEAEGQTAAAATYLDQAIAHYDKGMKTDLNDYYPSSNLPRLYRQRGRRGDDQRGAVAAQMALMACERARLLNAQDEWLNPTLLGLAFDAGDVPRAETLVDTVREEGPARWKLETTLSDLDRSVRQRVEGPDRDTLAALVAELRGLLKPPA